MARSSSGAFSRPLVRELDVSPAVLRRLAARFPERYPVLFDSAAEGPLSQASVLVAEPRAALWLDADGHLGADGVVPRGTTFLSALENWWLSEREPVPPRLECPGRRVSHLSLKDDQRGGIGFRIICMVRSDRRDSGVKTQHPNRCRASATCADYRAGYGRSTPPIHRHRRGSRRTLGASS